MSSSSGRAFTVSIDIGHRERGGVSQVRVLVGTIYYVSIS